MFLEQFLQFGGVYLVALLKHQSKQIAVCALATNAWRNSKRFDPAQVELALFAKEAAIQSKALLRSPLRPGPTDAGDSQGDRRAVGPFYYDAGLYFAHQIKQLRKQAP